MNMVHIIEELSCNCLPYAGETLQGLRGDDRAGMLDSNALRFKASLTHIQLAWVSRFSVLYKCGQSLST